MQQEQSTNNNHALVEVNGVKLHIDVTTAKGAKAKLKAVDGVSFHIDKGETFGLVGESGCGKTTLGKTLLRLYQPTDGTIYFDGANISTLRGKALKDFRCKAQMVFQDPSSCLNPRRKIREILLEPFIIHGQYTGDKANRNNRINQLCEMVGLSTIHLDKFPHELSGGQKQRVGIARALSLEPKLIVCDEPVSALDVSIQAQVINLLQDLQKQYNLTYLFISHNLSVVKHCCQRIAVMYLGLIVELAESNAIYENALHPYTKALISAIPSMDVAQPSEREILKGDLPSPVSPPKGCRFHTRCPNVMEQCRNKVPQLREVTPGTGHIVACHLYTQG